MVIVEIYLTIKRESIEDFITHTNDNVSNSIKEPGVIRFEFFKDLDADNKFVLFEMFKSVEDQNRHRETAHYKKWKENTANMLEVPYTRNSFEYVEME
jgi:quinol monooxygenase YgiN